jgi:hypothetical protein
MVILIWHNTYPIHRTKLGRIARLGENMSSSVHHLHKDGRSIEEPKTLLWSTSRFLARTGMR